MFCINYFNYLIELVTIYHKNVYCFLFINNFNIIECSKHNFISIIHNNVEFFYISLRLIYIGMFCQHLERALNYYTTHTSLLFVIIRLN